jgi:hypothetical protein
MKYMLMFFADEDAWMAMSEEERAGAIERIGVWFGQQAQAGRMVEGRRLYGKGAATTVRFERAGWNDHPVVVDGPFIEAKEAIGSYMVVEVPDQDEALAVARSWPGGGAVEVRPIMEG